MTLTVLIIALFLLISFSAVLSSSETALFSLSSMKVRAFKHGKDPRGHSIAKLLARPRKLMVTILMLNVVMNILVQNVVSSIFGTFSTWLLTVGVPLVLTLVFGEVIPKSIALLKNSQIAYRVAPFLLFIEKVLKPVRNVITFITSRISRLFFFFLHKEKEISLDEMKYALRTSTQHGVLGKEEAKLVRGYLNLEDDHVKEMMCPRQEILFFDIHDPLSKLIHIFVDEECAQIPVCDSSLEKVLGIMTSGSFFMHHHRIKTTMDLLPFLKKVHFIPESMLCKTLLREMYEKQESMMIIVDEYGSVTGLITLEDLVELVIGQITDRREEKSKYTRIGEDVLISSGKLELIELEELFDVHLESPNNMATVGGYLIEQLGDIPKSGTKFKIGKLLFHVLAADVNRVRRIYIRHLKSKGKK